MPIEWHVDIAKLKLSDPEKDGLQVYRNYSVAFARHGREEFVKSVDLLRPPVEDLAQVLDHVCSVEPRSIAVIACAFADDQLAGMFRREVPEGVPGGKSDLLNGMGSLGRLSQRIQVAYAFDWMSKDLLSELNLYRKLRNEISHNWNISVLEAKVVELDQICCEWNGRC